jgi:hypothetical protein
MSWLTRLESLALALAAVAAVAVDTVDVGSNLEVAAYHESTSFGTSWVTLTTTSTAVWLIWYTLKNA